MVDKAHRNISINQRKSEMSPGQLKRAADRQSPHHGKRARHSSHSNGAGSSDFDSLQQQRRSLPIFPVRKRLLKQIDGMSSAIVIGETGSGKTTQLPQYLYRAGMNKNHLIACTQPRRVAAMTVAQRVAQEMGVGLGNLVGYCVRFEDTTSPNTKVKYMTDGMLLREAILDPLLKKYTIVILDEAHERTIHTDVLFGVVKAAQRRRKQRNMMPLKIIVMSATMDVDHFSQYFNHAPVLYLEGRQYPVKLMYSCTSQSDFLFSALVTVFQIHQEAPPGEDILVFLTGQEDIESTVKSIRDIAHDLPQDSPPLVVCPMYAALPSHQQLNVFQPTPAGARKVIVATNIAETSVTIQGIKFVVDTGMVKAKSFNPASGSDMLKVQWISKAQAWQRTGRAGRQAPGTCYRLYTEQEFEALRLMTVPEIQRCNLSSVVLQLLALGIPDIVNFDFMDKPSKESMESAIEQLTLLGAAEKTKDKLELTPLGRKMAAFPLEPRLSKVLLAASEYKCLEEMLTVVSILSVESVLNTPLSKKDEASAARRKFVSNEGDHITLLNIYRAFKGVNGDKHWCFENFINGRNMKTAVDVRRQLRNICQSQELEFCSCGRDTVPLRKCLVTGFFMSSAEIQKGGTFVTLSARKPVAIHPSSSLAMCKPAYVIYNELVQTSKMYMRDLCVVDAEWLYETAPNFFRQRNPSKNR